jgi:hypothetical protein
MKKNQTRDDFDFAKIEQYGNELQYTWGVYLNVVPDRDSCKFLWWNQGNFLPAET